MEVITDITEAEGTRQQLRWLQHGASWPSFLHFTLPPFCGSFAFVSSLISLQMVDLWINIEMVLVTARWFPGQRRTPASSLRLPGSRAHGDLFVFQHNPQKNFQKTRQVRSAAVWSLTSFLPESPWQQRLNAYCKRRGAILCSDWLVKSRTLLINHVHQRSDGIIRDRQRLFATKFDKDV